jgi:hypothetical protein
MKRTPLKPPPPAAEPAERVKHKFVCWCCAAKMVVELWPVAELPLRQKSIEAPCPKCRRYNRVLVPIGFDYLPG